jgi:dTDP-glucose 4,6-dehydratase
VSTKILLTGGLGFSGSHFVDAILDFTDWSVIVLDCLTYAASLDNVARHLDNPRFKWIRHDISLPLTDEILRECDGITYLVSLGAYTHVAHSLVEPEPFLNSNVTGVFQLLQAARSLQPAKFLQVSTDEVYGASPADAPPHTESDPLCPSNPYSASKTAAEALVQAWSKSYNLKTVITRSSNLYGSSRQSNEKFIPMVIQKLRNHETVQIHTGPDPYNEIGSRQWLYVGEQSDALLTLLQSDAVGIYNVAGERRTNLDVVRAISDRLSKRENIKKCSIEFVNAFQKYQSHDLHYSISADKIERELGWKPKISFEQGLDLTL